MQPSSSTRATIVSAENQNGATIVKATFLFCHYHIVWESNNADQARGQSWNESLKSRWITGGSCGYTSGTKRKHFVALSSPRPCWRWLQPQPSCGSPKWSGYYAITETRETITETWKRWDVSTHFTKHAQTQISTFELHIYSGLNMNWAHVFWIRPRGIWCGIKATFKNSAGGYFLRYHFPPRVIKDHHPEWNNPLVVVFRKHQMTIFFKIRHETTIPGVKYRHLKVHYENLISLLVTHNKIWHVSRDLQQRNIKMLGSHRMSAPVLKTRNNKRRSCEAITSITKFQRCSRWSGHNTNHIVQR